MIPGPAGQACRSRSRPGRRNQNRRSCCLSSTSSTSMRLAAKQMCRRHGLRVMCQPSIFTFLSGAAGSCAARISSARLLLGSNDSPGNVGCQRQVPLSTTRDPCILELYQPGREPRGDIRLMRLFAQRWLECLNPGWRPISRPSPAESRFTPASDQDAPAPSRGGEGGTGSHRNGGGAPPWRRLSAFGYCCASANTHSEPPAGTADRRSSPENRS